MQRGSFAARIYYNLADLKVSANTENYFERCWGQFIVISYTIYNKPFVKINRLA